MYSRVDAGVTFRGQEKPPSAAHEPTAGRCQRVRWT